MPRRTGQRELPALTRALAEPVEAREDRAGAECKRLLALLRERCPDLLPSQLKAGEVGPEIPLDQEAVSRLYRLVGRQLLGLTGDGAADATVVWERGDNELAVLVDEIAVTSAPGALAVDIPVRCDQVGQAEVRVRFAVGSDERPAGLVAATDARPFGPAEVIDVWGEELTAFAWQIVLTATTKLADATGRDADGAGLIPAALQATEGGVAVLTMARQGFDRQVRR
jgi:hypothetical protein